MREDEKNIYIGLSASTKVDANSPIRNSISINKESFGAYFFQSSPSFFHFIPPRPLFFSHPHRFFLSSHADPLPLPSSLFFSFSSSSPLFSLSLTLSPQALCNSENPSPHPRIPQFHSTVSVQKLRRFYHVQLTIVSPQIDFIKFRLD
jgi:hypothetical protein